MKLSFFFTTIIICAIYGLSHYDGKTARRKVWPTSPERRIPASIFEDIDLMIFNDYFLPSTLNNSITHTLSVNFWTDIDNQYLKENINVSIIKGILNAAKKKNDDLLPEAKEALLKVLKNNIIESFISNFVKSIKVVKLINGTFQIDLNFNPEQDSWTNFDNELKSNELIRISSTGNLENKLKSSKENVVDKIIKTNFKDDQSGNNYQYLGGIITIWVKMLDLLPSPTEFVRPINAFIRYRRYYKIKNYKLFKNLGIGGSYARIDKITLKNKKNRKNKQYMTVDVYKKINGGSYTPYLDRMEIFYGRLIPVDVRKGNKIKRAISKKSKIYKSGNFILKGTVVVDKQKEKFEVPLNKIVYSFIDKSLTVKGGHFTSTFSSRYNEEDLQFSLYAKSIFDENNKQIIEKLDLAHFHNQLRN